VSNARQEGFPNSCFWDRPCSNNRQPNSTLHCKSWNLYSISVTFFGLEIYVIFMTNVFSDKQHLNKTNSYIRRTQLTDLIFSFQGAIIKMYLKSKKKHLYSCNRYSFKVQTSILLQAFIPTVQVKYKIQK
jgi:hypothetical protein